MKTKKTDKSKELPYSISDVGWESILPFLQACPNVYIDDPEDCRRFHSALLWITKEGDIWRAIPEVYGHWNTIYRRFGRWYDAKVFEKLHKHFHEAGEISALLVDFSIVRAHSCAAAAYDSDAFLSEITAQDAEAVICPRKNRVEDRPYDKVLYKLRNVVERFFHRLKQYCRVATRYDKYAVRYLGFVYFAAILMLVKKM